MVGKNTDSRTGMKMDFSAPLDPLQALADGRSWQSDLDRLWHVEWYGT